MTKLSVLLLLSSLLLANHTHKEKYYQDIFCNAIHGKTEYVLKDNTRIDCYDKDHNIVWETDFINKYYESIGQSLYYAYMTGFKAGVHIIVKNKNDKRLIRLKNMCDLYDIKLKVVYE